MKELIAWISFLGAIALGKVVGGLFYWLLFPVILFKYGTVRGVLLLFSLLFFVSFMFIVVYDAVGKDLLGVVTVKQKCLSRVRSIMLLSPVFVWVIRSAIFFWQLLPPTAQKFLSRIGRLMFLNPAFVWVMEFTLFTWQLLPPFVLLLMRRVDAPGRKRPFLIRGSDIAILFASSLVAILFWTFVHGKILAGFWNWIRRSL